MGRTSLLPVNPRARGGDSRGVICGSAPPCSCDTVRFGAGHWKHDPKFHILGFPANPPVGCGGLRDALNALEEISAQNEFERSKEMTNLSG